jgi:hypothetical protein
VKRIEASTKCVARRISGCPHKKKTLVSEAGNIARVPFLELLGADADGADGGRKPRTIVFRGQILFMHKN